MTVNELRGYFGGRRGDKNGLKLDSERCTLLKLY